MQERGFWIFQCRNCGMWGVKEVRTSILSSKYKCRYCNKSYAIKLKSKAGLQLNYMYPINNSQQASLRCQELNFTQSQKPL